MAACIRGPRAQQGSADNIHHSKSAGSATHHKSIIQIYTDWGNHYLEKARSKKLLHDLQTDLADGVLLADLVEAVIGQKVPDVQRKPKTAGHMVDNIKTCLTAVERLGINLEGVSVKEIRDGSLKSILALFFALSKYKQQLKLQAEANRIKKQDDMLSRLPIPSYQSPIGHGHQTSIPTPLSLRHNQTVHPAASSTPLKCPSASSSRSTSPSHSFIPAPRSARPQLNEKGTGQKVPIGPGRVPSISSPYNTPNKNSMLDKLKIFNPKDKPKPGSAKRTSSSSGFSSARSERSDSSTSLNIEVKPSIVEKKESSQNDISKLSTRKKSTKTEKYSRPNKIGQPRPQGPQANQNLRPQQINNEENQQETELIQPANPPPPPAPSNNRSMETLTNITEPLRVAGGGSCIPKVGGIPKPTAIVKNFNKPTHPVAPLPPVQVSDGSNIEKTEKKDKIFKPVKLPAVLETSHERQNSIEEVEEATANLKPMQPLQPTYNKRTIAIAPRTIPLRGRGYRSIENTYPRSNTERNLTDSDDIRNQAGYLSDGEVLHAKLQEASDGYMSEGGSSLYKKIHIQKAELKDLGKGANGSVELSNTDSSHHKTRILNGSGSGGVVREGGGLSPAQPHPIVYRVVGSRHIKKADSSQQTENSAFRQVSSNQWKSGGNGSLPRGESRSELDSKGREKRSQPSNGLQKKQEKKRVTGSKEDLELDFCNGERSSKGSSSGSSCGSGGGSKSKLRGSTPSFGYPKKPSTNGSKDARPTQVQVVSRTKIKVSGGTQTEYSGPQLSAGVRERLMMSSPKAVARHTTVDTGSLSDSNYAEITSPYASWLRHSAYTSSLPARTSAAGTMLEAESIESLPAQLHHRASLTHSRLIGSPATAPRLSRSNSIRSTKSEKLYPSMFQRSEEMEPYYSIPYNIGVHHHHSSQPTSPTPSQLSHGTSRFNYPISPISSSPSSHGISRPYIGIMTPKMNSKDDDVHGSAVSLVSTASSLYSTPEEKQAHEVRKLRKELHDAQEKVHSLTSQLSTNPLALAAIRNAQIWAKILPVPQACTSYCNNRVYMFENFVKNQGLV